ncbi:MAG: hypothetical protein IT429_23555 [Gemmataceae bacterium]|nr:hypothetical protein [Gemmataceae bacterium]
MAQHQSNVKAKHLGKPITMWRDGPKILIESPPNSLLHALRTTRLIADADPRYGCRVRRQRQPLYETLGGERGDPLVLKVHAALGQMVHRLLSKTGHTVPALRTLKGDAVSVLPGPDLASLAKVGGGDSLFLDFVRRKERGRIVTDPGLVSPARLVLQAVLAFPKAKVSIAVSRIEDGYDLRDAVRKHEPDVHFFNGKNYPWKSPRVAIATYRYLHHSPVNLFERDLVIALDAREAVCPDSREQMALAQKARLFGLVRPDEHISPFERDLMRMVFGFEELVLPRHGHLERGVRVVRCPVTDGPVVDSADVFTLLREGVWNNRPRSETIALLARLVKDRDLTRLQSLAPAAASAMSMVTAPRVVVLVDRLLHGLALADLLPGWPLLADRSGVNTRGLTAAQIDLLDASKPGWDAQPPYAIVTDTGMRALDLSEIDVVVRADAGIDLPALPAHKLIEPASSPSQPLLLIDLDDRHPLLTKRSQQRRRVYEERGWFAPGVDPVQGRVDLFLAARGL